TSLTSNGVMFGVAVAVVMYSQTRSLYWLLEFIMKSQPPAAEAGLQPSQSGGMAAPIFALYAGPSSFESAQPSPTVASIMPSRPALRKTSLFQINVRVSEYAQRP